MTLTSLSHTELLSKNLIEILEGFLFGLPTEVEFFDPYTNSFYKQEFTWEPEFSIPSGGTINLIPSFLDWENSGINKIKTNVVAIPFFPFKAQDFVNEYHGKIDDYILTKYGEEKEVEEFRKKLVELLQTK